MKKRLLAFIGILLAATLSLSAQTEWTPSPSRQLVNDYAGMLNAEQRQSLEQRLIAFDDSTSNQILIVITSSLHGDEIKAVGQRIGEKWGVGHGEFSNGVVILIKSKSEEEPDGEVAIITGYGLEGALPDIFCKHIIDDQMIEPLSEGDYYEAIVGALSVIEPVAAGEYSYAQYQKEERREDIIALAIFLFCIAISVALAIYAKNHPDKFNGNGNHNTGGGGGTYWMGGPRGMGGLGGFGGFSSGGFGGFGGGHFGGGGASGKF